MSVYKYIYIYIYIYIDRERGRERCIYIIYTRYIIYIYIYICAEQNKLPEFHRTGVHKSGHVGARVNTWRKSGHLGTRPDTWAHDAHVGTRAATWAQDLENCYCPVAKVEHLICLFNSTADRPHDLQKCLTEMILC